MLSIHENDAINLPLIKDLVVQSMCGMRLNISVQQHETSMQLLLYLATILLREQREGNTAQLHHSATQWPGEERHRSFSFKSVVFYCLPV